MPPTPELARERSTGKRVVRALVVVAVLVVVFGWLLPQFIDYDLIGEALKGLTWGELLFLLLLTVIRVPTEALIYRAMLPGLRIVAGSEAYLSSNAAANLTPPPGAEIIRYAYFRAEGFDASASMTGSVGSFVFPQAARIVLPVVAFVVLLVVRAVDSEAVLITGFSLVIVTAVAVLVWLVGRSETSARWVGRQLGRFVSWVMLKLDKEAVGDLGDQVVEFRDNAYEVVRKRWLFGSVAVAFNLALTYVILVAALRFVGIEQSELGLAAIFAAFAVSFFAGTVIPITGSGVGVVDVVMISALNASATGSVDVNVVVAGVVLWRVFYSFIALFPGMYTITRFAKTHAELLSDARSELGSAPAVEDA